MSLNNKSKIHLCSFASPDLDISIKRFVGQAQKSNFYNSIKVFGIDDLNKKKKMQIASLLVYSKRLYGYASWKPQIIFEFLKTIPKGDIVQYSDIGCHINSRGKKRLNFYEKIADTKSILAFQYFKPNFKKINNIKYQIYYEKNYTKNDLFKYFSISQNSKIKETEQFWSGTIFFKNNDFTNKFLKEWMKVCSINRLIDDSISKTKEQKYFKEHRHDQSIFSILSKKNKIFALSASECEWAENAKGRTWDHLKFFPILAKRDKKLHFLKRFYQRQIKNFKRFLK